MRPGRLTASWLVPTVAYTVALGALGVTGKLALRSQDWPQMVIWAAIAYFVVAVVLLLSGKAELIWAAGTGWALLSGAIVVGSLVLLYLALGNGDASKVIPITAAYPAVTLVLAAIFLSEEITAARIGGMALVLVGVVVLTVAD